MKIKINNFDPYNVFLAIATNIPMQLKTGFLVQGHIYVYISDMHVTHFYTSSNTTFMLSLSYKITSPQIRE